MDCVANTEPVPLWRNSVICKVNRLSVDDDDDESDDDDDKEFEELRRNGNKVYMNGSVDQTSTTASSSYHVVSNVSRNASSVSPNPVSPPPPASDDLLNVFDDHSTSVSDSTPLSTHASSTNLLDETAHESLLDFGNTNIVDETSAPSSAGDLLGMTMDLPQTTSKPITTQPTPPLNDVPNVSSIPTRTQQQTQQQRPNHNYRSKSSKNAFDSFSSQSGPFGDLNWG